MAVQTVEAPVTETRFESEVVTTSESETAQETALGRAWALDCLSEEEVQILAGVVDKITAPPVKRDIVHGSGWVRSCVAGKLAVEAVWDDVDSVKSEEAVKNVSFRFVITAAGMVEENEENNAGFGISGISVEHVPASDGVSSEDRLVVDAQEGVRIASSGGPEFPVKLTGGHAYVIRELVSAAYEDLRNQESQAQ